MNCLIVGVGKMGSVHMKKCIKRPDIENVYIYDSNEKLLNELLKVRYEKVQEYQDQKIDFAIIATHMNSHAEVAMQLIKRGISVLIEKPLCTSIYDAFKIRREAWESGSQIFVGHCERYNPSVMYFENEIKNSKVSMVLINRFNIPPSNKHLIPIDFDIMVHDIDLINYLWSNTRHTNRSINKDGNNAILSGKCLHDDGSFIYSIVSSWSKKTPERFIDIYSDSKNFNIPLDLPVKGHDQLELQLEDLINSISKGEPVGRIATIEDGINSIKPLVW